MKQLFNFKGICTDCFDNNINSYLDKLLKVKPKRTPRKKGYTYAISIISEKFGLTYNATWAIISNKNGKFNSKNHKAIQKEYRKYLRSKVKAVNNININGYKKRKEYNGAPVFISNALGGLTDQYVRDIINDPNSERFKGVHRGSKVNLIRQAIALYNSGKKHLIKNLANKSA